MSEYLNVSVVFKRIMKFWYLTMILPILFAGTAFYFVGKYQDANPEYAASAAFVVATKNDDSIANQAQSRIYSQNYADELVGTIGELARSRNVLSKAVMSVDGNNTYTTQQLQYIEVPQLASQVTVVKEISSMICNVTVTDESAKRAKDLVNAIVEQTGIEEKNIWGSEMVKPLSKAVTPLNKISQTRTLMVVTVAVLVASFLLISGIVLVVRKK